MERHQRFSGKVAVVTGSGAGIGRSTALKLASEGCRGIVINDIDRSRAEQTAEAVCARGCEAQVVVVDISAPAGARETVEAASRKWGQLDCLVNNAGICRRGNIWDEPEEQFLTTFHVNLYSTFLCLKYAAQIMKEQGFGSIVNISSTAGITGGTMGPSYGATKGAIIALSKHAAKSLAKFNVRVNCVAPGYVDTQLMRDVFQEEQQRAERWSIVPLGRLGTPEEIANAVAFLLSDEASFITGDLMLVSGGRSA
ncbi:MAG: SDR family oxidoreductase [Spirochaetales bacterium]|nr:SDR family oxidoreductase [Spirochaetales bacterium]